MTSNLIDVWNIETFDSGLMTELDANKDLLCSYEQTAKADYREQQASKEWLPHKENPYAAERQAILEEIIMPMMEQRIIRAWHHTRLTDDETRLLKANGVYTSDLTTIRKRLDAQVVAGVISAEVADAMYGSSPFYSQKEARSGKFWMTSQPYQPGHHGVELLLGHWGGEGVYFWLEDDEHIKLVQSIGRPRIIEIAIPLGLTTSAYSATKAVIAAFVKAHGCEPDGGVFDLYATTALGPDAVLNVLTEGDPDFGSVARGYPAKFTDQHL
ncbi:hypothetical protein RMR10_025190 (plasmid) [Agrobacterium rosae]|uniref:hypothetical protein n=1 Tax=Agrobacterium rosae TaxID=1972867 RepID=UPI002A175AE8|nr:hypothetical protein [Agrobacterium rosae]MDX8316104.1 hypothetical protein [Agrobacterium rosae]